MNLLNRPPAMDFNNIKWLEFKWSLGKLNIPKYDIVTFVKNNMKGIFSLSEKGLCLINLGIGGGENPTQYLSKIAMVDTGSSYSVVSKELAEELQLKLLETRAIVKGFEGTQTAPHSVISIISNELNMRAPMYIAIVQNTPDGVDLVLGSDFLEGFLFTRNGTDNTFTLEM